MKTTYAESFANRFVREFGWILALAVFMLPFFIFGNWLINRFELTAHDELLILCAYLVGRMSTWKPGNKVVIKETPNVKG
jgi:hypothetical protein